MIRNGMFAVIGTALLAVGGAAGAQAVVGGAPAGPVAGSGNSAEISAGNREMNAAFNERMGSAHLIPKADQRKAKPPQAVPATAADIKAGLAVRDVTGATIGRIVSLDGDQAVVDTGLTKIGVPLIAFGKDNKGLLLGMTAEKFNQLVAAAHAKSAASN